MGSYSVIFLLAALMATVEVSIKVKEAQLAYDYYKYSCPCLEAIVKKEILSISFFDASAPAAFLRLLFHDCQVQGCDVSILLDNDGLTHDSEMVSSKNSGVRHPEKIQHIKTISEAVCPGQVSCADIIFLAARESVSLSGGPQIQIPLGRKDSTTCSHQQADTHLISSGITADQLRPIFSSRGMNLEESVAILDNNSFILTSLRMLCNISNLLDWLTSAHTLGLGHCANIVEGLYAPHPGDGMNKGYQQPLKLACPTRRPRTNLSVLPKDLTPLVFDNQYYRDIIIGKGLFGVDSSLSRDSRTATIVHKFASDKKYFFQAFSSAFVRLSLSGVLTNGKDEVRRICSHVNKRNV